MAGSTNESGLDGSQASSPGQQGSTVGQPQPLPSQAQSQSQSQPEKIEEAELIELDLQDLTNKPPEFDIEFHKDKDTPS